MSDFEFVEKIWTVEEQQEFSKTHGIEDDSDDFECENEGEQDECAIEYAHIDALENNEFGVVCENTYTVEEFVIVVRDDIEFSYDATVKRMGDEQNARLVYDALWAVNKLDFGKNLDPCKNVSAYTISKAFRLLKSRASEKTKALKDIEVIRQHPDFLIFANQEDTVKRINVDTVSIFYINDADCEFNETDSLGFGFKWWNGSRFVKQYSDSHGWYPYYDNIPSPKKRVSVQINDYLLVLGTNYCSEDGSRAIYALGKNAVEKLNKEDGTNFIFMSDPNYDDDVICEICGETFEIKKDDNNEICANCRDKP